MRHNTLSDLSQNAQTGVDDACTACPKGLLPPPDAACAGTPSGTRDKGQRT